MAISQEQKTLVKIFQMCGLEKDIIIPLMIMLKNKPERMEQVVKYLDKEQRENLESRQDSKGSNENSNVE